MLPPSSMSALRSAGTNRPSSVSTAMPTSTCGCRVRVRLSPSNQALSAGTVLQAVTIARTRRAVMSCLPIQACRSASSTSVVGTTLLCASAITRAMLRRTPLSCSGWPLAVTPGGCVRIGLPDCESVLREAGAAAGAAGAGAAMRAGAAAPTLALPSAAARLTSSMVTTPSAPVARTRAMSTPSLRACARTAGIALTPPTATALSLRTASELCIAPTTVPLSSRAASVFASGAAGFAGAAGAWSPPPWWWPVSWPSARCGNEASSSNSASILPVTITSPGPPASLSTLPETGDGTSTTAFAVSIDTSGASSRIVSPGLTIHSTMVASGRPSPRSGSRKVLCSAMGGFSIGNVAGTLSCAERKASARGERALGRGDDAVHARQVLHLQTEQRDVRVVTGDALDRREQVEHRLLGQARGDFGAEPGGLGRLVHDHAATGAADRFGDGGEVERTQRGDIDDLGTDAVGGQLLGGFQRFLHLRAPGHEGDVGAVAQHVADIQRQCFAVVGNEFLVLAVDALGLHEDHRIRIADRGEQQAIGARRRGRQHHAQARHIGEDGFVRLGMVFRRANATTPGHAQHHRAMQAAARAIAHARGMADDEVDHRVHEAVELGLGHRLHALRGHADGQAGDGGFVQRRVEHALGAEGLLQAGGGAEHAAVDADVLAEHDDRVVMAHLVGQRLRDRFDQRDGGGRGGGGFGLGHGLGLVHERPSSASAAARCSSRSGGGSAYR